MKHRKNLKWIFFCLLSHIFKKKKKVYWDTGNKWIFLQTEQAGGGGRGGILGRIHSLGSSFLYEGKNPHSLNFFFSSSHQQPAGLVVAATGNLAILQGLRDTFRGTSVASHPRTPCTRARHRCLSRKRLAAISHRSSSTQNPQKNNNRISTMGTLAHTNSQHDNTY